MIRPMDWRDLAVLHRMRTHGLCLDSQLDSTRGPDAFHDALLDPFSRRRNTSTLIARSDDTDQTIAVGQFTHYADQVFAHLTFLGPTDALSQPSGLRLIDALSQAAGSAATQDTPTDRAFVQLGAERLVLNGAPITLDDLAAQLKTGQVLVSLDDDVSAQRLVDLLARMRGRDALTVTVLE